MAGNSITLKWGTLKGWDVEGNKKALEALKSYFDEPTSWGVMSQKDTPTQKGNLCRLIDAVADVDGEIWNDWDGIIMSPEMAKYYVLSYDNQEAT